MFQQVHGGSCCLCCMFTVYVEMAKDENTAEHDDDEEEEEEELSPLPAKRSKRLQVGTVVAGDHVDRSVAVNEGDQSTAEERRLAKMMLSKKRKRLYEQIVYSQKRKAAKVKRLKQKREEYERTRATRPTTA